MKKFMKGVYRLFGITTEYWALDIFEGDEETYYEIVCPLDDVEEDEEFSAQTKILTFWVFRRPVLMRINEDQFEEFVNPHIAAK